jgi:hypothetical protein
MNCLATLVQQPEPLPPESPMRRSKAPSGRFQAPRAPPAGPGSAARKPCSGGAPLSPTIGRCPPAARKPRAPLESPSGAAWKPRARIRRRPLGSPLPCRVKAPTTLSACPRRSEAPGREPIGSHGAAFFCALTRCPARLSATPLESPPDSDNGLQKTPPCVSCQRRSKAHAC